jgi:hypothetical protein
LKLNRLGALSALVLAAVAVAVPAAAEEAKPVPCAGMLLTDPSGDAVLGPVIGGPPGVSTSSPANMDVTGLFFNATTGSDGKTTVTGNMEIANLDTSVPDEAVSGGFSYFFEFATTDDDYINLRVENSGGEISYWYSYFDPTTTLQTEAETTGRLFEGPQGIVQIDFPPELSNIGRKLEAVYAYTSVRRDDEQYAGYITDTAPDDGATAAKTYTVSPCAGGQATATATATGTASATATATATATGTPSGGPPSTTPSGTQPARPNPGSGTPATPAKPAKKKAKSCAAKAKKKFKGAKNKKKLKAALKKCRKSKKGKR